MRKDNRDPRALRPIEIVPNFAANSHGSVLYRQGGTAVLCTANILEEVPKFLERKGKGWITAEYSMLPGATHTRGQRESTKGKVSGRTHEIQRLIGRSLRSIVDLTALGERTIWIDCDVLQADGGTRTASISGSFIALCLALQRLVAAGTLKTIPVTDHVAAVSVGMYRGDCLLDLDYEEDSQCDVDMNVVMTGAGAFVEVQGTAEKIPFGRSQLDAMLGTAESGIRQIFDIQRSIVRHCEANGK